MSGAASPQLKTRLPGPSRKTVAILLSIAAAATLVGSPAFLRGGAPRGGDLCSHFAEIATVSDLLRQGQSDFWFSDANLGYPLFIGYHPLPALLMGCLAAITGTWLSPLLLFKASVVFLLLLLPACWYRGARWLGLDRIPALFCSLFVLCVRDFTDTGIGPSSVWNIGLYTQLWGLVVAPVSIGSTYRYLRNGKPRLTRPALLLGLAILCHLFVGYLCAVAGASLLLTRGSDWTLRLKRLLGVLTGGAVLTGFWWIPFLLQQRAIGGVPYPHPRFDGFPASETLRRMVTGDFLDFGRIPWLSGLALCGGAFLIRHERPSSLPSLLSFAVFNAVMMLGPTTWGPHYRSLPLHSAMEVFRYLMGLQMLGLLLASFGASALIRALHHKLKLPAAREHCRRWIPVLASVTISILLLAHWSRSLYEGLKTFDHRRPGYAELVNRLSRGDGRLVCDQRLGTGDPYHYNLLPTLAGRPQLQSYGRGYYDSPSTFYVGMFQFTPEEARLFNVREAVSTCELHPEYGLREVWRNQEYRISETDAAPSYFDWVRVPCVLVTDRSLNARTLTRRLSLSLYKAGALPQLESGDTGDATVIEISSTRRCRLRQGETTLVQDAEPEFAAAKLLRNQEKHPLSYGKSDETVSPNRYSVRAENRGTSNARLLLKASYHPYWTATIDDRLVPVLPMAPSLMGVDVPPGTHQVIFHYRNPLYQKLLFIFSITACAGMLLPGTVRRLISRIVAHRSGRGSGSPEISG